MGKFDKRAVGEKEGERAPVGKRRKLAPVVDKSGSERTSQVFARCRLGNKPSQRALSLTRSKLAKLRTLLAPWTRFTEASRSRSLSGLTDIVQGVLVDKILRERSDDIVDVNRAVGKMEATKRAERHEQKKAEYAARLADGGGSEQRGRKGRKGSQGRGGGKGSSSRKGGAPAAAGGSKRGGSGGGRGRKSPGRGKR